MAVLTTTITEDVFINGAQRGSTSILTVTGVNEVLHRLISVPLSGIGYTTLMTTDTTGGGSTVIPSNFKYLRVTNSSPDDVTASLYLKVQTANSEAVFTLDNGESFVLTNKDVYAGTGVDQAFSFANLKTIKAGATGAACLTEVFVATA